MNRVKKYVYITIGFISLGLGIIGILLPVLPTTPFLLLTSICFMRGSEKFDKWFRETKIYKKHLETFVIEKAMTMKQKISILLFVSALLIIPLIIVDNLLVRGIITLIIIIKYYYFIFKIKTIKTKARDIKFLK